MWRDDVRQLRPMLAKLAEPPLSGDSLVFEPKYDGIRALVAVDPAQKNSAAPVAARLWARSGNEKTAQFPELATAVGDLSVAIGRGLVLDGEIVALGPDGEPASFETLQQRMHLSRAIDVRHRARATPTALIVFDVLRDGDEDLRGLPLAERRARLESMLLERAGPIVRLARQVRGDGRELYTEALARGWEGLIVKDERSPYRCGFRGAEWRKLKIMRRQPFVVAGWTSPRGSRDQFGALLVGYYQGEQLRFAGQVGSGFDSRDLIDLAGRLGPLETPHCPFSERPETNEKPHWTRPRLVVEVKFLEWTRAGTLRQPVFVGLRDGATVKAVTRDGVRIGAASSSGSPMPPAPHATPLAGDLGAAAAEAAKTLVASIDEIAARGGHGRLVLPDGVALEVSNLGKVFWPELGITKGDLFRYYARVSPFLLPVVADRPLVMKRFPNGVDGEAFYQHRAPSEIPRGVRLETLADDHGVESRLVGGSLATLLYMVQLAVISQDPWFSRAQSSEFADQVALDLDPMDGVPFTQVLDVARSIRDVLDKLGFPGVPKTSGASGLHIFIPLAPGTPYQAARLFSQIIATTVARKHPRIATVERAVGSRGATVYIDYLQNIRGKTLACAYSARASTFAGASTPLTWHEVDAGFDTRDFTMHTVLDRLATTGDLWQQVRSGPPVDLREALDTLAVAFPDTRPSKNIAGGKKRMG